MKGPATGGSSASLLRVSLFQKDGPSVRTAWRSVHKGILGILINVGIGPPPGETFGLLYGVHLRSESMRVLGYIYGGVSFVEGAKEDL